MSVAVLLGGFDPPTRRDDIGAGRRPANDVTILEGSLDAEIYDFTWLDERFEATRRGRLMRRLVRRTGQWSLALAVMSAFEVRRFDVTYVSGEDIAIYSCAIGRLRRRSRPRFVVRFERASYGRTRFRRWLHRQLLRFASQGIDVAICRTVGVGEQLRSLSGMPADRVRNLGQEIDVEFFDPEVSPPRLDVVPSEPFVLSAGLEKRDYRTLLDAMSGLDCALVIAAGSPWSKDVFDVDGELPDGVLVDSFGPVEMRALYAHAAVVVLSVHPTERACGMNVVGEAWAMARPVVASGTSGLREFITDDRDGVLVPVGDADALREALRRLLSSPSDAAALGAGGRRTVVSELSLARFEQVVRRAFVDALN